MIDNSFIAQCIICEITLQNQKGYVVVTYRSPSQSSTEFDEFLCNFDQLLNHIKQFRPSFTIILGNFNARSKSWWPEESLTMMHGLQQLISDPSCIDLIFTNQSNLAVNSGAHPSLHVKCHHQIIHCKFNLMIVYPPPYQCFPQVLRTWGLCPPLGGGPHQNLMGGGLKSIHGGLKMLSKNACEGVHSIVKLLAISLGGAPHMVGHQF